MARLFPVMLKLENRGCLVVGGGEVAERKVNDILLSSGRVKVVAPLISPRLNEMAADGLIEVNLRPYMTDDLEGMVLVIAATDDKTINHRVAAECRTRGILVNVVDDPEVCDIYIPAVLRRGALTISVSTEGKSPLLAKKIKEELANVYGEEYAELIELLGEIREKIKDSVPDIENRRNMFLQLVEGPLLDMFKNGGIEQVKEWLSHVYSGGRLELPNSTPRD